MSNRKETKLKEVYNPDNFKNLGHELVDLLTEHLKNSQEGNIPVTNWKDPIEQYEFWKNYKLEEKDPIKLFKDILEKSINLHHPNYMGIKYLLRHHCQFYRAYLKII